MKCVAALFAFTALGTFAGSASAQTTTSTSLTATPNQLTLGNTVTLTATVTPGSPTGNVSFFDGANFLGVSPLVGSTATFKSTLLNTGRHSMLALYGGDSTNAQSLSTGTPLIVTPTSTGGFNTTNLATDSSAVSVATGDFNGDLIGDLVSADQGSNHISVFLNNGDGTFQAGVVYAVGTAPSAVAVTDVNLDGKSDIVVVNQTDNTIGILLGNGDGTFQAMTVVAAGFSPRSIKVGDFNLDGYPDLAVTNTGADNVSIFLNNHAGSFAGPVNYSVPGSGRGLTLGDFNADGKSDIAVANFSGSTNVVSVLLGNGDGTFQASVNYTVDAGPTDVVAGDFNSDGKLDLAVANSTANTVSVLLGSGSGTFATAVSYAAPGGPFAIVYTDVNGDNDPDLVTANTTTNSVAVLRGNGDGTFQAGVSYPTGTGPRALLAASLNGDSLIDLAVANTSNSVSVMLGGQTSFTTLSVGPNPAVSGQTVTLTANVSPTTATGSINFYDGSTLLATVPLSGASATYSSSTFTLGSHTLTAQYTGNAQLAPSTSSAIVELVAMSSSLALAVSPSPSTYGSTVMFTATVTPSAATGKVTFYDGVTVLGSGTVAGGQALFGTSLLSGGVHTLIARYDGDANYVPATSNSVSETVTVNNGGGFQAPTSYPSGSGPIAAIVGDFNRDGHPDIATANYVSNTVSVILGNGNGTFQSAVTYSVGASPIALAMGDFNGDGAPDLVVANYSSSTLSVLLGRGDGTFAVAGSYTAGSLPEGVAIGDFNGDGVADIAVTDSGSSQVGILLGVGDGTFTPSTGLTVSSGMKGIVVADFNGDLKADIAVAAGNGVYVMIGNGDGTFGAPVQYVVGSGPSAIAATNLGNGTVDIIVVNSLSNTVSVLVGVGDGTFNAAVNYPTDVFPQAIALGDFNGDGKMDVAVADEASNDVSVLYSNGDGTLQNAVNYPVGSGTEPSAVVAAPFHGTGQADLAVPGYQSNTVSVLLALMGSQVGLSATPNPDPTGEAVTLTATVLPSVATGGVTFYSGNTSVGSASVVNGVATITVMLGAGSQVLTAVYSGDTVYGSSVSQPVTENVAQTATITSIAVSANPATYGNPVTLTSTVNESAVSGFVTFYFGTTVLGQGALVNGIATLTVPAMPAGSGDLVAQFDGSAQYAISRSNPLAFTIAAQPGFALSTAQSDAAGSAPVSVTTADVNGDGYADLVVANSNGAGVLLGNGNGTFQAASSLLAGTGPTQVITADFNSDGRPDIAVSDAGGNNISVLLGNGDGTFQAAASYGAGAGPTSLTTSDFNGDGIPDLAVANRGGTLNILLGKGDGTFNAGSSITVGTTDVFITTGDFNGDGKADLAVADATSNSVWVLLGNGDGTFQNGVSYQVGSAPNSIAVGDFNNDGKMDMAVTNQGSGNLSVMLGTGSGVFAVAVNYTAGANPTYVAAGDFTGDGKLDLIVTNQAGSVGVMIGSGTGTFAAPVSFTTGLNPVSIALGNFNGDGRTQAAVANEGSNSVSVFLDAAAVLTIVQGASQSAPADSNFATPLAVQASGYGAPMAGVSVVFTAPASGATGIFNGSGSTATVVTGANGIATAPTFTANGVGGAYNVTATAGGAGVQFALTNTASGCIYTVKESGIPSYANTGGSTTFSVTASAPSCTWGAASSASFVTLSTMSVEGSGSVTATVGANTSGLQRTATLLIAGQSFTVTEAATAQVFADVPPTAYYFDAVNTLYSKGITAGCSSQPFDYCPTATITRAQMAVFLVRSVYGGDNFTYSPTPYFTDVPANAFGFAWIQKLYELGITTGCGPNLYCPNNPVARDQMAVFLVRTRLGSTAPFPYVSTPYFTDVPTTEFAFDWIQRIKQDQITSGCTATTYCPSESVTRGDMAILLDRAAFNLEMPANYPVISQISPAAITLGSTVTMTVTGLNTNWSQGLTTLISLPGVTFATPTVTGPTSMVVQVTIDANAIVQPYSVTAVTGEELDVLPNHLTLQ